MRSKFMKVDVLGLGMLGCMRRAFGLLRAAQGASISIMASPVFQERLTRSHVSR